jgi:hypothetical protein
VSGSLHSSEGHQRRWFEVRRRPGARGATRRGHPAAVRQRYAQSATNRVLPAPVMLRRWAVRRIHASLKSVRATRGRQARPPLAAASKAARQAARVAATRGWQRPMLSLGARVVIIGSSVALVHQALC